MLTPLGTAMPIKTTSGETVNYGLPQWHEGDITTWMNDLNYAMNTIDNGMFQNKLNRDSIIEQVTDSTNAVTEMKAQVQQLSTELATLTERFNNLNYNIGVEFGNLDSRVTNQNTAIVNLSNQYAALKAVQDTILNDIGTLSSHGYYVWTFTQADLQTANCSFVETGILGAIMFFPSNGEVVWAFSNNPHLNLLETNAIIDLADNGKWTELLSMLNGYEYRGIPRIVDATGANTTANSVQLLGDFAAGKPRIQVFAQAIGTYNIIQRMGFFPIGSIINGGS